MKYNYVQIEEKMENLSNKMKWSEVKMKLITTILLAACMEHFHIVYYQLSNKFIFLCVHYDLVKNNNTRYQMQHSN